MSILDHTPTTSEAEPTIEQTPWPPPAVDVAAPAEPEAGRDDEPADTDTRASWERPALVIVLAAAAVLYLWGLGASGWANSFYSAAAQAGSQSWKAWFFGASDAAGSITVDKPPASLWIMGLSVRLFGLSSWSILVPQALMGVGTVAVVHRTVRRWFSAQAAIVAALAMATTPVAALMFRFNNPDALLVLVMALAAHAVMRGIDDGHRRWIALAGVALGFGFLAKQLQVLLVVPPLALAYLVAAPGAVRRRVADVLIGGAAMVGAAGWWVVAVMLTPASQRPYIGGSQDNSILELTLGYNGFGRLTGNETGSVGGGGGNGGGMWGETGITRMFDGVMGGQIAWLLPASLIAIVVTLWFTRRAPRTDRTRAGVIVWGGWLVVTALVFSFMQGIFHEYYTVALAPAIAVTIGVGADVLWRHRHDLLARLVLSGMVVVTVLWSAALLGRAPTFSPWLRPTVVTVGVVAAAGVLLLPLLSRRAGRSAAGLAAAVAVAACLAGPTAWALDTASTPQGGSIVTAGPAVTTGGPGGRAVPGGGRFPGGGARPGRGAVPGGGNGGGMPTPPDGFPGNDGQPTGAGRTAGGAGGLLDSAEPSQEVVDALMEDADDYTWVAATVGSNRAAGFQLATERSVMPIGGFNGSDPSPTLEEFQQYVADGEIHWFVAGGNFGGQMGGSQEASEIASWVQGTFESVAVGGVTLYDLSTGIA